MSTGLVYPPGCLRRDRRDRRGGGGPVAGRRPVRQPHPQRERRPGRGAPRGDRDRPPARRPGRGVPPQGRRTAEPRPRRGGAGDPRSRPRRRGARPPRRLPVRRRQHAADPAPSAVGPRRRRTRRSSPGSDRPRSRARIAADVATGLPGWPNYIVATGGWDGILIAAVVDPSLRWLEGKTVARAAAERDMDPLDARARHDGRRPRRDDDDRVADGPGRRGRDHRRPVDLDRVRPAGRHDARRPRPSARLRHVRAGARPLRARAGGAGPAEPRSTG